MDVMEGITDSTDMNLSKLQEMVKDREVWHAAVHGVTRVRHNSATEQLKLIKISSVQSLSRVRHCNPMNRSSPGLPVHHQLPESTQTHIQQVDDAIHHLILCLPLLLLPSIFPSIRVFSNESALCIRWPKYWSLSFNISTINEHPGLISFRMDWLDLLAVQGTLKSLLQHHSSKS